jgi:hypothetical protein
VRQANGDHRGEEHRYEQAADDLPTGIVNEHGVDLLWYAG